MNMRGAGSPPALEAMQRAAAQGGRKRVFLGLLSICCCFVCMLLLIFFILPWFWAAGWLKQFSIVLGSVGILVLAWLGLILIYHIYTGRALPGIRGARHLCARLFLPLMELAGPLFGVDKNLVRRSFIKVNNEFVCANRRRMRPEQLLVLLPHCLQARSCPRRLGRDLANCANCGQCQIGAIRELASRYGFRLAIATGGTVARRIVAELKPLRIIAVACERDLTAGIQDTYPLPVFGVLNDRPDGPCVNTRASLETLEAAIICFLGEKPGT